MEIGNALNVALSLMFVYLLLSLMASVIEEFVAGAWNSRGRDLRAAIGQMLGDPSFERLAGKLYSHPLVTALSRPGWDVPWLGRLGALLPMLRGRLPSYLAPEVVADALTDILRRSDAFETGNMQPALAALWRSASGDMTVFRSKLIAWFEEATAREGGAYKRKAQRWLFVYGLGLAVVLNVDTLNVAGYLWTNRAKQEVADLAAKAEAYVGSRDLPGSAEPSSRGDQSGQGEAGQDQAGGQSDAGAARQETFAALLTQLKDLKLPIGWDSTDVGAILRAAVGGLVGAGRDRAGGWLEARLTKPPVAVPVGGGPVTRATWLGWVLTALAVSLGAQFWFDTLGKVVGLRASGRKPNPSGGGAGTAQGG